MSFHGFDQKDFDVFAVEGLDERMHELKKTIRPKLETLGEYFKTFLSEKTNDEMYYHVAKHARRKVNPPKDTWVAFCNNNRGYKKLPHFQIGMFGSHLFIWFAVIYESPVKNELSADFLNNIEDIEQTIPDSFVWSIDHTKPDTISHKDVTRSELQGMLERLGNIKKAELLCGKTIDADDPLLQDGEALLKEIEATFNTLLPLYNRSIKLYEQTV
ncbi:DUF1054 domain-containing protein [Alkalicoccus daliensis]|uniref:UPF0637 protein SAMN04488053_101207 n=1 Tax=Alkalicoccus daliensis TaxID=745820 RepID=A0A1G9ZSR6_9BACI|nr:DUF1054 domain-containing protein [Alkalicoccus daliensis]SDN23703.1 Uncharacterized protein YktB, UPF0637 family [Alkalicoccus daliensis]